MLSSKLLKVARLWFRWKQPFQWAQKEASEQYVGKQAKVATLSDVIATRDHQEIGDAERDAVQELRAKHGFGGRNMNGKPGDRDNIVCDDMQINAGRSSVPEILLIALIAIALFFAWKWYGPPLPATASATATATAPEAAEPPATPDSAYEVLFYEKQPDGSYVPLKVDRLPENVRGG